MQREIRYTQRAQQDLFDIWDYISNDNMAAADQLMSRIYGKVAMLAEQPESGRERPELIPGLRSFPVGNYLVFYRLSDAALTIDRVLNAARDISPKTFD